MDAEVHHEFVVFHFLSALRDPRFREAIDRYTDLGVIGRAANGKEVTASALEDLETHWVEARADIESRVRRWCAALDLGADRPADIEDRVVFLLGASRDTAARDEALMARIVRDDYGLVDRCDPDVRAEVRRVVPRTVWSDAYLVLDPEDGLGSDSTTEATLLVDLAVRSAVWRLHRLLIDPHAVPPPGPEAGAALRRRLGLHPGFGT